MAGLRTALEKLNAAVEDLTSLHVQTFTGSVEFTDEDSSFDNVRKTIQSAANQSKITLVAESLFKFDGDSYNFMVDKEAGIPASALELHKSCVDAGIKTRQGLLQMVKGVFD